MGANPYRTSCPSPLDRPMSSRALPRRQLLLSIIRILTVTFILIYVAITLMPPKHHTPGTPPSHEYLIHGKYMSEIPQESEGLYPLHPFPETPIGPPPEAVNTTFHGPRPWLAAVISSAFEPERRMLIRATWMKTFRDTVPFDTRFVISNPGPQWTEIIQAENRTFGDLIVLDHLQEDDFTANTIKTLEFYKYLVTSGSRYEFVTKLDTDLFLNARGFWERYLRPRLTTDDNMKATVERTGIGELYYHNDLAFLHGPMYTYTWDIIEELVDLQDLYHVIAPEDAAVSILLLQARRVVNMVNLPGSEKFDYDDADSRGDGTPWAQRPTQTTCNATKHALCGDDPIAVHNLKTMGDYLKIAAAFDEDGIKAMPPGRDVRCATPKMLWASFWNALGGRTYLTPRIETVPEYFYDRNGKGDWVIDGIWNMGSTRTGYQ